MTRTLLGALLVGLVAGCSMTPEQRCLAGRVVLAGMEGGGVPEGYTLGSARSDVAEICDAAGMSPAAIEVDQSSSDR